MSKFWAAAGSDDSSSSSGSSDDSSSSSDSSVGGGGGGGGGRGDANRWVMESDSGEYHLFIVGCFVCLMIW
jgi:hypothetical protein